MIDSALNFGLFQSAIRNPKSKIKLLLMNFKIGIDVGGNIYGFFTDLG